MRRIRLLFLGLSAALLVPMALLLHRAVGSVALERQMRHRAVAERIFDEMERALSDFLTREEARALEPPAGTDPAEPSFVLGRFAIDPDGHADTFGRDDRSSDEELARVVAGLGPRSAVREGENERANAPAQIPGTTVGLAHGQQADAAVPAAKEARTPAVSAYDALRALNKSAQQRAERQKTKEEASVAPSERHAALADSLETGPPPMRGRIVDAERLVLQHTVLRGARAYRQGVVLDVKRLAAWLGEQAIGSDGLAARAHVSFSTPLAAADAPGGDFVYQHRFADPFADLTARLALATLPGVGSAGYVYGLSAALVFALVLGLVALYRMVSVAVAFAERRSNFVAAVSHELKTPLTAIRMYGEMLRDGIVASDGKRQEYYRHITAESERLSRLINNVLEFARLEKGAREVSLVTAPVTPVVREAVELVRPHLEAEGFALEVETNGDLPPARFERDALLQVLFNLIDNAVKYAADGGTRRIILRVEADGPGVRIVVRDHGPGVPERHLAHVFEPFYRGERELTRRSKGTGLGLALVRGLVGRMGGHVAAQNGPGGGFEVTIALAGSIPEAS
jgi:signal transduction histidine kinase